MMDDRYLDLLKKVLTGNIYQEESAFSVVEPKSGWSPAVIMKRMIIKIAASHGIRLTKSCKFVPEEREEGRDWPGLGYTMVGLKRLDNVQHAIETVIRERIPGDLCECGVWRGGTAMFMRAALMHYGENGRSVWVADSFSGLPKPDTVRYPGDSSSQDHSEVDYLSVSLKRVRQNFQEFGLLDENVRFLEGWFKDTLPTSPIKQLAILRADGDLYESTMDILINLYGKVVPGGFVIIDDYYSWEGCRLAVTDFRASREIVAPIERIDWTGAYWRIPPAFAR
jgi:O-methyltransferase